MNDEHFQHRPRRGERKLRWGKLVAVLVLFAFAATTAFWGAVWCYDAYKGYKDVEVVGANEQIIKDERLNQRINVLLLGIDDGDSEAASTEPKRTDAMILASFDPDNNEVAIVSLPRDTMVKIPGHKQYNKLNAAYAFGGVQMAKQTVANLLNIPIHHYALLDWRAFVETIDLLGGIDIYVEKDMYYSDPYANLLIDLKRGYQHLDGKKAGHYIRFRNDELGDIGRVQRQQKFMNALASQMFNIANIGKIPTLFSTVGKYVHTDMDMVTMVRAVNTVKLFGERKIKTCMLYGSFYDAPSGNSYWRTSPKLVEKTLDELNIPYMKNTKKIK